MTVPIHLRHDETFVLNLGPQHPATHGASIQLMRLIKTFSRRS